MKNSGVNCMESKTKVKITKEEFDEYYEIEGITGETQARTENDEAHTDDTEMEDTTPIEFSEEELEADNQMAKDMNWDEELE